MLKNENIICISSIDWDFIWQGHQEIMSKFAKNGNRVLFIENTGVRIPSLKDFQRLRKRVTNWFKSTRGFSKKIDNLYVYSPIILPFPYSKIARWLNRRMLIRPIRNWIKIMEFHNPIIWTFLPTGTALDIINYVERELLIYYCIADFYELVDNPNKVKKTEDELIGKSDLVFVQGKVLQDKCKRLNNDVYIFPFGVSMEAFENFRYDPKRTPADIRNIKGPIVGYVGGLHRHIDFDLLRFIAEKHPRWSLVLVGPTQTNTYGIEKLPNVFILGKKDFSELPYYINQFDVGIIPYNRTGYTDTVYPTKLNEYHALGKPVISTELPEILNFNVENSNLIKIGKTFEEFTNCISRALSEAGDTLTTRRISAARMNSWTARIEDMSNLIEEAINRKSKIPLDWQRSFLKLYKTARIKIFKAALTFLTLYFLVFYTPVVWFLASPLKISQMPQKADAIVVFAGGVGESGKAGQGYEERVLRAVELYKGGFARYLILSSGYAYTFREPFVMKALALSLGVPKEAIVLEDKAANTYENVKLVKLVLDKNNWKRILLVSSPYHMRRASFVFKKMAPGIEAIYTPPALSIFYIHGNTSGRQIIVKQINIEQIRGLLHEYLGIIYYWLKGYA